MKHYCLGFAFSENKEKVLLIKKMRPEWQAGFLNGVGGKLEEDEPPVVAMEREFKEETGLTIRQGAWNKLGKMQSENFVLHIYYTFTDKIFQAKTTTNEEVKVVDVKGITSEKIISNLGWIVPMCIDEHVLLVDIESL